MAFKFNNNVAAIPGTADDSWKSQGFINFYLPKKDGGKRKLGSIGLKASKPAEKELLDWLNEDPSRIGQLFAHCEVEYKSAEGDENSGFSLDFK